VAQSIASSAHIDPTASLGENVIIEENASVGANTVIGNQVTIKARTIIGDDCTVSDFALLGKQPKLGKSSTAVSGMLSPLAIANRCSVGSHTVLMAGSSFGNDCIVGDNAGVRERCIIGDNVIVGRSVTVENDTTIGSRTRIQSGAYVTAYVTIEDDVFIAPMVVMTNDNYMGRTEKRLKEMRGCTVRRGARVGGGVHILPRIEIGEDSFIATGSVVTRDVPPRMLVMGAPAKPVRPVANEELLGNQ